MARNVHPVNQLTNLPTEESDVRPAEDYAPGQGRRDKFAVNPLSANLHSSTRYVEHQPHEGRRRSLILSETAR